MYSYHPIEHPGSGYVVATAASFVVVVVRFTLEGESDRCKNEFLSGLLLFADLFTSRHG